MATDSRGDAIRSGDAGWFDSHGKRRSAYPKRGLLKVSDHKITTSELLSHFFYEREFEQSSAAVVVLKIDSPLSVVAANRSACERFGWPCDHHTAAFAHQLLELTGLHHLLDPPLDPARIASPANPTSFVHRELGTVDFSPFRRGEESFAIITIKREEAALLKHDPRRSDGDTSVAGDTNSMAVAHWIRNFIHELSQPLHVNQSVVDILDMQAENGQIDSASLPSQLARLQTAAQQLRQCLIRLRNQLHLLEPQFTRVDLPSLLRRAAVAVFPSNPDHVRLAMPIAASCRGFHGNETLLETAIRCGLETLGTATSPASCSEASRFAMQIRLHEEPSQTAPIQIELSSDTATDLAFVDAPLLTQSPSRLFAAAKWQVC
ncbi:MAG: hypothetical protein ACF788_10465, partial [Novipirellula sp. JB048]